MRGISSALIQSGFRNDILYMLPTTEKHIIRSKHLTFSIPFFLGCVSSGVVLEEGALTNISERWKNTNKIVQRGGGEGPFSLSLYYPLVRFPHRQNQEFFQLNISRHQT